MAASNRGRDTGKGIMERRKVDMEATFHLVISHGDKEQEGRGGLEIRDQT